MEKVKEIFKTLSLGSTCLTILLVILVMMVLSLTATIIAIASIEPMAWVVFTVGCIATYIISNAIIYLVDLGKSSNWKEMLIIIALYVITFIALLLMSINPVYGIVAVSILVSVRYWINNDISKMTIPRKVIFGYFAIIIIASLVFLLI